MKRLSLLIAAAILIGGPGCAVSRDGQTSAAVTTPAATDSPAQEGTSAEKRTTTTQVELAAAADQAATVAGPPGATSPAVNSNDPAAAPADKGRANLKTSTMGGRFFWTDELVFHDWRIQRHSDDGHYRLIDGKETRHAWGTFDECRTRLEAIKREQKLEPMVGKVVLVLHGLGRSRVSNEEMVEHLRKNSKFTVLSVGYASTQGEVADHARSLARVIENLGKDVEEINFVAHSLGNIVIRRYLADRDSQAGGGPDPRIKRIVMVGAPNNGARMAEIFGKNAVFERITGRSGRSMAREWADLAKHLVIPQTEFGIIAGGKSDADGYNPLLPGDDDLVVAVEETKLAGARDFVVIEALHALMMNNPEVQRAAQSFLEHGYFTSEEKRQPLLAPGAAVLK